MSTHFTHSSLYKILILVFGIAFGLVALSVGYKAVKEDSDIRSRAALEGDTYKSWDFTSTREGWVIPSAHKYSVAGGILNITLGNTKSVPVIKNVSVNTSMPIGKKYVAMYISLGSPFPTSMKITPAPQAAADVEDDPEFAKAESTAGMCTADVKLCPDGTYVSRSGPSCAFAACPTTGTASPTTFATPYPPKPTGVQITRMPTPITQRTYEIKVYYKLSGRSWTTTPIVFSGALNSAYQRIVLPFPETLPMGGAVKIERLRIAFTKGFKVGDTVHVDWIQLLGSGKTIPTLPPRPTGGYCAPVTLTSYTPVKPTACPSGSALGVNYTCSDKYTGGTDGVTCKTIAEWKVYATQRCESRSLCGGSTGGPIPTNYPKPSSVQYPTATPTPSPTAINTNPPICTQSSIPPATGSAPLTVTLYGSGSAGNGPGIDGYRWDFENAGRWDTGVLIEPVVHTYTKSGVYYPVYQVHGVNDVWSSTCSYPYKVIVNPPAV